MTIFGWAQEATIVLQLWILIVFCLSSKFSGKIIGNEIDGVFVLVCCPPQLNCGPDDKDKVANFTPGSIVEHDTNVGAVIVGSLDRKINYYKIQYAQLCINENPGCLFIAHLHEYRRGHTLDQCTGMGGQWIHGRCY